VPSSSGPADLLADLEDVRGVLAERGSRLQIDQIRATLRMLEEALGQSDLLRVFEREVTRRQDMTG